MKTCTICKIEKNLLDFNKNKTRKDGLNNICKDCSRKRSKQYYNDMNQIHKKNVLLRNKNNRKVLQEHILNLLNNSQCKDCGNKDIRVLEFDHLPEFKKENNISKLVAQSNSLKKLKSEIDKCEIVCSNCHKIRTYSRNKSYRN